MADMDVKGIHGQTRSRRRKCIKNCHRIDALTSVGFQQVVAIVIRIQLHWVAPSKTVQKHKAQYGTFNEYTAITLRFFHAVWFSLSAREKSLLEFPFAFSSDITQLVWYFSLCRFSNLASPPAMAPSSHIFPGNITANGASDGRKTQSGTTIRIAETSFRQ